MKDLNRRDENLLDESYRFLEMILSDAPLSIQSYAWILSHMWDLYRRGSELARIVPWRRADGEVVCVHSAYRVWHEARDHEDECRLLRFKISSVAGSPYSAHVFPTVEVDKIKYTLEQYWGFDGYSHSTWRRNRGNVWVVLKQDGTVDVDWYRHLNGARDLIQFVCMEDEETIYDYGLEWLEQYRLILKQFHDGIAWDVTGDGKLQRRRPI